VKTTKDRLLTIGDISNRIGIPQHRVAYAIKRYGVEPAQRAGMTRLWTEDCVERIAAAVRRCTTGRW